MSLQQGNQGAVLWMGFNAYFKTMHFELPEAASQWCRLIDTALPAGKDLSKNLERWSHSGVPLEARSLVVMVAQEYADRLSF